MDAWNLEKKVNSIHVHVQNVMSATILVPSNFKYCTLLSQSTLSMLVDGKHAH